MGNPSPDIDSFGKVNDGYSVKNMTSDEIEHSKGKEEPSHVTKLDPVVRTYKVIVIGK